MRSRLFLRYYHRRMPTDTAVTYARLSRKADSGKVMTVGEQERVLKAEADGRGLTLAGSYVDDGVSAFKRVQRPGFDALVDEIRSGHVRTVLTVAIDRTARRMSDLARLVELAEDVSGLTLIAGGKQYDLPDDATMLYVTGLGGEQESRDKSRRVLASKQVSLERGLYAGGRRPMGYRKPDGAARGYWVQDEAEAAAIRKGARMVLAGKSLAVVAKDWNEKGITRSTSSAPWTSSRVKRTLESPIVAGLRSHKGEIVGPLRRPDGTDWPAILTPEQREQIQAALRGRYAGRPGRWHSPNPALLSGLLTCGRCGHRLTIRRYPSENRGGSYTCAADGGSRCGGVGIARERVEELVTEAVMIRLDSAALRKALRRPKRKKPGAKGEDAAVIQAELDELATAAGSGQITMREYLAARPLYEERLAKALAELADDDADVDATKIIEPALDDPRAYWEQLDDLDGRRSLLSALIRSIPVAPALERQWDPKRVSIEWRA